MYKLSKNPDVVIRVADGTVIPRGHRWFIDFEEWVAQGNAPEPADVPELSEEKRVALDAIDQVAGLVRQKYLTTVPGQESTYLYKAQQADAYKAAGYPPDPDPVAYCFVIAEKESMGLIATYAQAAEYIINTRDQWVIKGAEIEGARRTAKVAIEAATSTDGVEAALQSGRTSLQAL